jgi:excisionase family DNA binding protein
MPIENITSFLVAVVFVFTVSGLLMLLTARPASSGTSSEPSESDNAAQEPLYFEDMEEQADEIDYAEQPLAEVAAVKVPHIELPGAHAGGGATAQHSCKISGIITLDEDEDPDEKRKYNRRLKDRRCAEIAFDDEDKRVLGRRALFRRQEDHQGKRLIEVTEAADMLGVPVERIYRWLDKTDIPFCKISEGKNEKLRFEVSDLLRWYGDFSPGQDRR